MVERDLELVRQLFRASQETNKQFKALREAKLPIRDMATARNKIFEEGIRASTYLKERAKRPENRQP